MSRPSPSSAGLGVARRVAVWDAALERARRVLREAGLQEVTTPVRLDAVALEPWIEPVAAPPGWLATSPELPMKRLLCRGAPSIFQIAHVHRQAERGELHAEEFHLVEWYRHGADPGPVMADVEALVAGVGEAVEAVLEPSGRGARLQALPTPWRREGMLDLVERTTGLQLRGDEPAAALLAEVARVRPAWTPALTAQLDDANEDGAVQDLAVWTAFFSAWSDDAFDPWLRSQGDVAVHVVEFPVALAALAEVGPSAAGDREVGHRFESHVARSGRAVELANGYRELRDATEQRRRFDAVARLRARHRLAPLPMPEAFLADLSGFGLPLVAGAALGLDRLVLLATGAEALADIALVDVGP